MKLLRSVLVLSVCAPGLAAAQSSPAPPQRGDDFVIVGPPALVDRYRDPNGPDTLFLNRCVGGCAVTRGANDARNNQSSIPAASAVLSEFSFDDATWNAVVACVRDVYLPYGVEVVTTEPPFDGAPYVETMVAGSPAELGLDAGTLGIAPVTGDCSPGINWIAFAFANVHTAAPDPLVSQICATVAHEAGHIYGLEHAFECSDPMTYLVGCGDKYFRNLATRCGAFEQTPTCMCGGTTQNTHLRLLAALGTGGVPPAPTVRISLPAAGASVSSGFSVFAAATDPHFINRVELLVNGWEWVEVAGVTGKTSPYDLPVPAALPDGVLDLDVRACNDLDVCATERVRVTQGAPCSSAASCAAGQQCDGEGRCFWDPPTGELGDACTYPQACLSGVCADVGGGDLACTRSCFGGPNDVCPEGFACSGASGQEGVCAFPVEDTGGCCAASGGGAAGPLGLGLLVGVALLRRRRARRSVR